jgi:hypothetical protein
VVAFNQLARGRDSGVDVSCGKLEFSLEMRALAMPCVSPPVLAMREECVIMARAFSKSPTQ